MNCRVILVFIYEFITIKCFKIDKYSNKSVRNQHWLPFGARRLQSTKEHVIAITILFEVMASCQIMLISPLRMESMFRGSWNDSLS